MNVCVCEREREGGRRARERSLSTLSCVLPRSQKSIRAVWGNAVHELFIAVVKRLLAHRFIPARTLASLPRRGWPHANSRKSWITTTMNESSEARMELNSLANSYRESLGLRLGMMKVVRVKLVKDVHSWIEWKLTYWTDLSSIESEINWKILHSVVISSYDTMHPCCSTTDLSI